MVSRDFSPVRLQDRPIGELGCGLLLLGLALGISLVAVLVAREPKSGPVANSRHCKGNLWGLYFLSTIRLRDTGGSFPRFESDTDWVNWLRPEMHDDPQARWCLLHCPEVWHLYRDAVVSTPGSGLSGPASAAAQSDYAFNMGLCGRALSDAVPGEVLFYEREKRQHTGSRCGVTVDGRTVECVDPARMVASEPKNLW
jgi:hypothetical protein